MYAKIMYRKDGESRIERAHVDTDCHQVVFAAAKENFPSWIEITSHEGNFKNKEVERRSLAEAMEAAEEEPAERAPENLQELAKGCRFHLPAGSTQETAQEVLTINLEGSRDLMRKAGLYAGYVPAEDGVTFKGIEPDDLGPTVTAERAWRLFPAVFDRLQEDRKKIVA